MGEELGPTSDSTKRGDLGHFPARIESKWPNHLSCLPESGQGYEGTKVIKESNIFVFETGGREI